MLYGHWTFCHARVVLTTSSQTKGGKVEFWLFVGDSIEMQHFLSPLERQCSFHIKEGMCDIPSKRWCEMHVDVGWKQTWSLIQITAISSKWLCENRAQSVLFSDLISIRVWHYSDCKQMWHKFVSIYDFYVNFQTAQLQFSFIFLIAAFICSPNSFLAQTADGDHCFYYHNLEIKWMCPCQ